MSKLLAFWRHYRRNVAAVIGLAILTVVVVMAVSAPLLYPGDPWDMAGKPFIWPFQSWKFPLGTDRLGRDVAACIFHGARVSLLIGVVSTTVAVVVGIMVGAFAGFYGGKVDDVLMRLTEIFQTIPSFIFIFVVVAVFTPTVPVIVLAIAIVSWPQLARLVRGEFIALRGRDFIQGCIAIGMSDLRIIFAQALPNALAPVIVTASVTVALAILAESGLAFLGLGDPNVMSWGTIIGAGRAVLRQAWYLTAIPGVAILLTVLSLNLIGDGLNDALNPRLRAAMSAILEVRDLRTVFRSEAGTAQAVDGISLQVGRGETLALVGESGCGKSMTGLSLLRIVPKPYGHIVGGEIRLDGRDLLKLPEAAMRQVRGNEIAMIFQEPMTSLNPVFTIGDQIVEAIQTHRDIGKAEARRLVVELLDQVGIPDAGRRLDDYPHRLSGGMRQRAMIAMAISCRPKLLIADEPTTALDVTVQAQILALLRQLQDELAMGMILITHDLAVVAETASRVAVMYAGRIVENGTVREVLRQPQHPYTQGLLQATPHARKAGGPRRKLAEITGLVPSLYDMPPGCAFAPRCPKAQAICLSTVPTLGGGNVACHFPG